MIYALLAIALVIVVTGKLHATLSSHKPEYLLSARELIAKWTVDNNWAARFSLLFLPLIFVFNVFAWLVFGIETIYAGCMFLIGLAWKAVLWLWKEVVNPTIGWTLRMLWHYLALFTWKFFHNAFVGLRDALLTTSIVHSAKRLFILLGLSGLVLVIALLLNNVLYAAVGLPILYLLTVYSVLMTLGNDATSGFQREWVMPVIKKLATYFGFLLAIGGALGCLTYFNDLALVSALGLSLSQALIPLGIGFSIILAAAVSCVPAFVAEQSGNLSLLPLLRALLRRLPKLVFGAPFVLIGLLIVSLVPIIVFVILNSGIGLVTGNDIEGWSEKVQSVGVHIPAMVENSNRSKELKEQLVNIQANTAAKTEANNSDLSMLRRDSAAVQGQMAAIPIDQLHTHGGDFYPGESQFFSMPTIEGADFYKLFITYRDQEILMERIISAGENDQSILTAITWVYTGQNKVEIVPVNQCGEGQGLIRTVSVVPLPKTKSGIARPEGPSQMCAGNEAEYTTQVGLERYEWELPTGVSIIEDRGSSVKVEWGNESGTIRVRAFDSEGDSTLWIGRDVQGFRLPGGAMSSGGFIADEGNAQIAVERPFLFKTKEEGLDSLQRIISAMNGLVAANDALNQDLLAKNDSMNNEVQSLSSSSFGHLWELLGKILGLFGLVLLFSVLWAPAWRYIVGYNFRLMGFHQVGEHYWEKQFREMRESNPVQPYLGWFVLAAVVGLLYVISANGILVMLPFIG